MGSDKEKTEVVKRLSRTRKPSRSNSEEKIDQSLEVLGFKSWQDLEKKDNTDGSKLFDKEKLNIAFRNKVIEVEEKKQSEKIMNTDNASEGNKDGDIQRQMLEAIISNLTDPGKKKKKSIPDEEPDVYEAYQIILAEHYKRAKQGNRKASFSSGRQKKQKRHSISASKPSDTGQPKQISNDITKLPEDIGRLGLKSGKAGKKKVTSSGYGQNKMNKSASTNVLTEYEEIQNPMLEYVTNLTRTQSYSNVRDSRFRKNVKKLQKASALTKLFNSKGNQKHLNRWKLLLQ